MARRQWPWCGEPDDAGYHNDDEHEGDDDRPNNEHASGHTDDGR